MRRLGVLLLSGGHERAHYALIVGTGAAALGRTVTLFATNEGCRLFAASAPLVADARETAIVGRGVAGVAVLLEAAAELGIRRIACEAGLRSACLDARDLAPGVEVAGIATLLDAVGDGQIVTL